MSCTPPSLNRCRSYALSSRTWSVRSHPARRKACSSQFEPCWRIKARSKLGCAQPEPLPLPMPLPHPIFSRILEAMESQTYDSLPRVPDQWMEIVKAQVAELWPVIKVPRIHGGGGGAGGGGMLPALSKNKWKHPNPNRGLLTCWKAAFAKGYCTRPSETSRLTERGLETM